MTWISDIGGDAPSEAVAVTAAPADGGVSALTYASFAPTSQLFTYVQGQAIYLVNLEGGTVTAARQLNLDKWKTPLPLFGATLPRWSADSAWLAYLGGTSTGTDGRTLFVVNTLDAGAVGKLRSGTSPACDTSACANVVLDFAFQP